ncbi:reverse transcriptase, partial [Colletotrichum sojae]
MLDLTPERDARTRYVWHKVDRPSLCKTMASCLEARLGDPDRVGHAILDSNDSANDFAQKVVAAIREAVDAEVPTVLCNPANPRPQPVPRIVENRLKIEERALRILSGLQHGSPACKLQHRVWMESVKQTNRQLRITRTVRKRQRNDSQARTQSGLYSLAKRARSIGRIRGSAHMPRLKRADGTFCETDAQNALCYRQHVSHAVDICSIDLIDVELSPAAGATAAPVADGPPFSPPCQRYVCNSELFDGLAGLWHISVMHFRKPRDGTAFEGIPDIPILTFNNLIRESREGGLRVLGVKLDHALSWKWHIDH